MAVVAVVCSFPFALCPTYQNTKLTNQQTPIPTQSTIQIRLLKPNRKVSKAYFSLLEVLCHGHAATVAAADAATFGFVLSSLEQGLKSVDVVVSSACASAVDNLAAFYFRNVVAGPESGKAAPGAEVRLAAAAAASLPCVLFVLGVLKAGRRRWCFFTTNERMTRRAHEKKRNTQKTPTRRHRTKTNNHINNNHINNNHHNQPSQTTNTNNHQPPQKAMEAHLRQQPHLLPEILKALFEVVLFEECSNQWSLSRPMLSLILCNEAVYPDLQRQVRARVCVC